MDLCTSESKRAAAGGPWRFVATLAVLLVLAGCVAASIEGSGRADEDAGSTPEGGTAPVAVDAEQLMLAEVRVAATKAVEGSRRGTTFAAAPDSYNTASNSSSCGCARYVPFGALACPCARRKLSDLVQASKAARDSHTVCEA